MQILRITRSFFPLKGGQENHILNISQKQIQHGVETTVITIPIDKKSISEENYKGIRIIRSSIYFSYGFMTRFRLYFFIFGAIISAIKLKNQKNNFDLVIGHDYWSGIAGLLISKFIFKTAFIYFAHGIFQNVLGKFGKFIEKIYLKYLPKDYLFCVNDGTAGDDFILKTLQYKKKFIFLPHGIDVDIFRSYQPVDRSKYRKKFNLPLEGYMILNTAKINKYKGSSFVAQGFLDFTTSYPNINSYLVFANEPYDAQKNEYQKIIDMFKKHNKFDKLYFTGNIKHENVPYLLNAADVWVSMASYSNAGNALLEAMACELPVIASNTGSTGKMINHNVTGFLVEDINTDELKKALLGIFNNKSSSKKIGQNASRFVTENNNWERRINLELKIYNELI